MKAGNCWRWRSAMGVMVASALAFAVSVQGGPRVTDGKAALNKGRVQSDTARLVTGPSEHVNSVVAGGGTAVIRLTPRYRNGLGTPYPAVGYNDSNISGQTLTVNAGGFRSYWDVETLDWAPQILRSTSGRVDAKQFEGDNAAGGASGCDLAGPMVACTNPGVCIAAYGTPATAPVACNDNFVGFCNWGWIDESKVAHADGVLWVHHNNFLGVNKGWGLTSPLGPLVFSTADPSEGNADAGGVYYIGTMSLDVPACAKGTYTLSWIVAETFLADPDNVPMPMASLTPGVLTIPTGKCCHHIGQPTAGCTDGLTQAECAAAGGVTVWGVGDTCDNPPGPDGCAECTVNADCKEKPADDLCTDDTCDAMFICHHANKAGWDPGECCDAATGAICTPTPRNVCTNAACSIPPDRGVCVVTALPEGATCKGEGDDNPCTFDDECFADESCKGTDVNSAEIECVDDEDCQEATGLTAPVCIDGLCECSLVPDLTIEITDSGKKDENCFEPLDKVTATVHVAAATAPVNGGQFLITYDPTCLDYISVAGVAPYVDAVYGPVVDEGAGTIFVVVGVGFGAGDGPAGNADILSLSFAKIGECDSCQICFASNNPMNTYLVDNTGQKIPVNPICSKPVMVNGDVAVVVPESKLNLNVDCDQPSKVVTWDVPYATDTCGESTVVCYGEHESGMLYSEGMAMHGGELPIGVSNFCCYAASNWCGQWDGCAPGADCPAVPAEKEGFFEVDGCWTVDINDETSLDIELQLSPSTDAKPGDELTRCIKFTLYPNTIQEPLRFTTEVIFGANDEEHGYNHIGKVKDKIKIPGSDQWDCISAWDQFHTLRSCYLFGPDDCFEGQLNASFTGDPLFGGNWLIGGNLDGWKKDVEGADPSLFVIDILDYGTFVAEWGEDYGTGDTTCSTVGPHADIDGDGNVDLDDYAFIQMNFLMTAKLCCGVEGLPAAAVTSISVRELRETGRGELAVADLNGDGMLDMNDMNAFAQGARPTSKSTRTGR